VWGFDDLEVVKLINRDRSYLKRILSGTGPRRFNDMLKFLKKKGSIERVPGISVMGNTLAAEWESEMEGD